MTIWGIKWQIQDSAQRNDTIVTILETDKREMWKCGRRDGLPKNKQTNVGTRKINGRLKEQFIHVMNNNDMMSKIIW